MSSQLLVCSCLIYPIHRYCLFFLLIGGTSPCCGATGVLEIVGYIYHCSFSLAVPYLLIICCLAN